MCLCVYICLCLCVFVSVLFDVRKVKKQNAQGFPSACEASAEAVYLHVHFATRFILALPTIGTPVSIFLQEICIYVWFCGLIYLYAYMIVCVCALVCVCVYLCM